MSVPNPATTDWVPMWNLSGTIDLNYKGAWVAGTYKDGDVVVDNGIAYIATMTTSVRPTPWPGSPNNLIPAVTSAQLTAITPYDGQLVRLIVDATAGIEWTLAYRAASASAYKWEFVGGPSLRSEIFTDETWTTTAVWADVGAGPKIVLPRSGEYRAQAGATIYTASVSDTHYLSIHSAGTGGSNGGIGPVYYALTNAAANWYMSAFFQGHTTPGCPAGSDLRVRHQHNIAGTAHAASRWIEITPVRVS